MLFKIISLFLIGMAVLAMFGKWRLPKIGLARSAKCPSCGRPKVGKGPCGCRKD